VKPVSEEEMKGYVEGFKSRAAAREARRRELEAKAAAAAASWVERLRRIPEVRRVILYGSLAKGTFGEGSDVDLAVEGLPAELHYRLASELEGESESESEPRLDLERWEEFSPGFREVVLSYGKVLYERG
jgi:predicted nucleotidyltransferase